MNRITTVRSFAELGAFMRDQAQQNTNDDKEHGEGQTKPQPDAPLERAPDEDIIEKTLPARRPVGPTDI